MNTLSDTQICASALVLLGQNPIADIADASVPNAVKCNAAYVKLRDAVLREYDWNFARGRAQLAQVAAPAFGWQFAFQTPKDFLAARIVNDNFYPWAVEGNTIVTNGGHGSAGAFFVGAPTSTATAVCNLVYTRQITESGYFDTMFTDCLSLRIAAELAVSILKDASKSQLMLGLYEKRMPATKRVNASEGSQDHEHDQARHSSWISGRGDPGPGRGGRYWY